MHVLHLLSRLSLVLTLSVLREVLDFNVVEIINLLLCGWCFLNPVSKTLSTLRS